jgi:drug/metabolite transporter (DMT)-like permease
MADSDPASQPSTTVAAIQSGANSGIWSKLESLLGKRLVHLQGPLLVVLGASLWATDALFRVPVTHRYSPLLIVTINHVFLLVPALFILRNQGAALRLLSLKEWAALIFISCFGSVLGTVAFTEAFVATSNYSVPVLIQKIQPCFAILLARVLLRETVRPWFWLFAAVAVAGAYLLSFGFTPVWTSLKGQDFIAITYALLAALTWGSCTVVSRLLLQNLSFTFVTAARFVLGAIFALALSSASVLLQSHPTQLATPVWLDSWHFFAMAFISGLIPILIYYRGLKSTSASVASLCELAFPLVAILLNWLYLDSALNAAQLLGAGLIVFAITGISLRR